MDVAVTLPHLNVHDLCINARTSILLTGANCSNELIACLSNCFHVVGHSSQRSSGLVNNGNMLLRNHGHLLKMNLCLNMTKFNSLVQHLRKRHECLRRFLNQV